MTYQLTITSSRDEPQLRSDVAHILATSAFTMVTLSRLNENTWQMVFAPRRQDMVVGFTKFAELQLGIARLGDIVELRRTDAVPTPA